MLLSESTLLCSSRVAAAEMTCVVMGQEPRNSAGFEITVIIAGDWAKHSRSASGLHFWIAGAAVDIFCSNSGATSDKFI